MDVLSLAITSALLSTTSYNYTGAPTINWTELDTNRWWGPANEQANQDTAIHPASITFSDDMITDLRDRLNSVREFTPPLQGIQFQYGFNTKFILNWTKYWAESYDFKAQEANFNKFPMFKTNIQGMDIFYIRVTPEVPEGVELVPMLLLHGWPGSIREFFDVIPLLTAVSKDRDFAIDLIVPSLCGFGFSEAAVRPGLGAAHMAVVFRNLMKRLGFDKYYIQGGDFGAIINGHLATLFPEEVLGYHTNWGVLLTPVALFLQMIGELYPPLIVKENLYSRMYPLVTRFNTLMTATGYLHMHATKPDTIGLALTDSPAGLLAYVFEKYATAIHKSNYFVEDGGLFEDYDPNFLIDTLMYYWSTSSIQTAMRLYSEFFNMKHFNLRIEEIPTFVPTWVVQAVDEFTYQSEIILSLKYKNMLNVTALTHGGHFLAHQEPAFFSEDVHRALTAFRAWHVNNS